MKFLLNISKSHHLILLVLLTSLSTPVFAQSGTEEHTETSARQWTEAILYAIRRDLARPTVHARNLFHLSAAMYDAWSLFDDQAAPLFMQTSAAPECGFSTIEKNSLLATLDDIAADRKTLQETALGHAAWNLLNHRFQNTRRSALLLSQFQQVATRLNLDKTDEQSSNDNHPARIGLRVANCIIAMGKNDTSNETNNYANNNYQASNTALDPTMPGNPGLDNPNRWQPLLLGTFVDQSGVVTDIPNFLGADWGLLEPFALTQSDKTIKAIDDTNVPVWLDPGTPPQLTDDPTTNATYQAGNALVVMWSAHLDPDANNTIDISPGVIGNLEPLSSLATDHAGILAEYNATNGGLYKATGHSVNPYTGEAYSPNLVALGDYTRVLAEFWADGPDSETPPGHWFAIYNKAVASHPLHETRLEGSGELIDPLQYDLLAYLALGGAMHDSAIAAWSVKRAYDYVRPISAIRYMASLGQSTDFTAGNYHVHGIPLQQGYIETVLPQDPLAGSNNENTGKIKARAWRGPGFINNPAQDVAGVDWILLENWWPYQRPAFVTPPFAGYVSGHSTFSRAAAEVLTLLTGDVFFPGGLAEFVAEKDSFLAFEKGPAAEVRLQWATYRDAADQTSLSRIWGGIHPPADDIAGRRMGEQIGKKAWQRAKSLANGDNSSSGSSDDQLDSGINDETGLSGSGCSIHSSQNSSLFFPLLCFMAFLQIIWRRKAASSR